MKRIFLIGMLIASALLTFVACGDETVVTNKPENAKTTLSFTIQGAKPTTRASQTGKVVATPALDREKSITKLYLAAFTSGKFHKVLPAVQKSGATYEVSGVGEGSYDCYLVANPDDALINKLNALTTSSTVDDFDAIVTTQTAGEDNKATNFLMTSQKTSVTIVKNKTTDAGTIKLLRVAARFDIYNTISDLNMTKVTFKNRYINSRLNRGSANTNMGSELKKNSDKTYEKAQGLLPKECIGCIYGYENMTVGETILTLEATYNGKQIKPFDIVIEDIPVKRNHMYSIIISPKGSVIDPNDVFGSLDFNIKVNDWNEATTLSIPSNDLVETSVADFTVSGTYVQGSPLVNPTEVVVTKASATELEVKVTSKGTAAKLTPMSANGYTVTGGESKVVDGKLEQIYTIKLAANTTGAVREFDFVLANGLKEDAKKVFKVKQVAKTEEVTYELIVKPNAPVEFLTKGGSKQLEITARKKMKITENGSISSSVQDVNWTPVVSGEGFSFDKANKTVKADVNSSSAIRTGKLVITIDEHKATSVTIDLKQATKTEEITYELIVNPNNPIEFLEKGGSKQLEIIARKIIKVTENGSISSSVQDVDWTPVVSGEGFSFDKASKTVKADVNSSNVIRMGELVITIDEHTATSVRISLKQDAFDVVSNLPLAYVAEYDLDANGKFATSHAYGSHISEHGYFTFNEIDATVAAAGGNKWHLPSKGEWQSIFGEEGSSFFYLHPKLKLNVSEEIEFPRGTVATYKSDYNTIVFDIENSKGLAYALKMKNPDGSNGVSTVAYRYRLVGTFNLTTYNFRLVIDSKYIGNKSITIEDVSRDSFWNSPDITRTFPYAGYLPAGSYPNIYDQARKCFYWSATKESSPFLQRWIVKSFGLKKVGENTGNGYCIRLFENKK